MLISFDFWQRRFGGDPSVLGQALSVGAETGTKVIIGVCHGAACITLEPLDERLRT